MPHAEEREGGVTASELCEIAREVVKRVGRGHTEAVYQRALVVYLNKHRIWHRTEVPCPFMFMGEIVGSGRADLVVGDLVVELKASRQALRETSPQLLRYMESLNRVEGRPFGGVVINFHPVTGEVQTLEEPPPSPRLRQVLKRARRHGEEEQDVVVRSRFFGKRGPACRLPFAVDGKR